MSSGWKKYFAGKDISQDIINTLKKAIISSGVNVEINDGGGFTYDMVNDTITIDMSAGNGMKTDWTVAHELFERYQFKEMSYKIGGLRKQQSRYSYAYDSGKNKLTYINKGSALYWYIMRARRSSHNNIMVIVDEALLAYQMGKEFFKYIRDFRLEEISNIEAYYQNNTIWNVEGRRIRTTDTDYTKKPERYMIPYGKKVMPS